MKVQNNIGWCDETTNAVTGCDKVSPGCKNCYAESGTRARVLRAQGKETWGANGERVPVNFEPVFRRLNKLCVCDKCHSGQDIKRLTTIIPTGDHYHCEHGCGNTLRRIRLFADSNSDWLDPKWPVENLARFLDAIRLAPNVDVQLLTKRIELWRERMLAARNDHGMSAEFRYWMDDWYSGMSPSSVWLGVSVEDQQRANERIPLLLKTPAAVRFLSVEPLLEEVQLFFPVINHHTNTGKGSVDWVIVGGESGKNRRDCGVEAIESVVLQCALAGVPVYCKQDSTFLSGQKGRLSENAWRFKEFPT